MSGSAHDPRVGDRAQPVDRLHKPSSPTATEAARSTYYGIPVIHKPHWKWLVIVYFFLGGIAAAAYVVAVVADLVGPRTSRQVVRTGRYLSLATLVPCPILLILDLGRPERFYNMLRVLKLRSPMSVGTWGLTTFGAFSALLALIQAAEDGLLGESSLARWLARLPGQAIGVVGVPFGFFVGGYTGVLLGATAVPLWTKRARFLGPLFLSSAMSTAVAGITAILALARGTPSDSFDRLERLERIAMLTELTLLTAWLARLGPTARPLTSGANRALLGGGTIGAGLIVPLWLQVAKRLLPRRAGRPLTLAASLLVLTGGFTLRYAVVVAGAASADDPRATFDLAVRDGPRQGS